MSLFLASVTDVDEAHIALQAGVDLIDLKNPLQGALGALPTATIARIVGHVAGRRPVSATVGDLPMHADSLLHAVESVAATGVDIIKVGLFPAITQRGCVQALAQATARGIRLIAVYLADRPVPWDVEALAEAGFYGAMLDTASKQGGTLRDVLSLAQVADFVAQGRQSGLFVGLAGSLGVADIAPLSALQPHYLGFRGALCKAGSRTEAIEPERVLALRRMLHKYHAMPLTAAA
jgi:uncharacterized protein (UPF0264 family)